MLQTSHRGEIFFLPTTVGGRKKRKRFPSPLDEKQTRHSILTNFLTKIHIPRFSEMEIELCTERYGHIQQKLTPCEEAPDTYDVFRANRTRTSPIPSSPLSVPDLAPREWYTHIHHPRTRVSTPIPIRCFAVLAQTSAPDPIQTSATVAGVFIPEPSPLPIQSSAPAAQIPVQHPAPAPIQTSVISPETEEVVAAVKAATAAVKRRIISPHKNEAVLVERIDELLPVWDTPELNSTEKEKTTSSPTRAATAAATQPQTPTFLLSSSSSSSSPTKKPKIVGEDAWKDEEIIYLGECLKTVMKPGGKTSISWEETAMSLGKKFKRSPEACRKKYQRNIKEKEAKQDNNNNSGQIEGAAAAVKKNKMEIVKSCNRGPFKRGRWTEAENLQLKQDYVVYGNHWSRYRNGRSPSAVASRARHLKLVKSVITAIPQPDLKEVNDGSEDEAIPDDADDSVECEEEE